MCSVNPHITEMYGMFVFAALMFLILLSSLEWLLYRHLKAGYRIADLLECWLIWSTVRKGIQITLQLEFRAFTAAKLLDIYECAALNT